MDPPKNFFFTVSASTGINLQIDQRFSKSKSGPAENAIFWYHLTWNAPSGGFMYSPVSNRSAAPNSSARRKNSKNLIIVPSLIVVPVGRCQVYRCRDEHIVLSCLFINKALGLLNWLKLLYK